jgi:hypothetical protein
MTHRDPTCHILPLSAVLMLWRVTIARRQFPLTAAGRYDGNRMLNLVARIVL